MEFEMQEPVLIVGLGGAGCKLAIKAKEKLNSECLLISHDAKDLESDCSRIMINTTPVLNPSSYLIRGVSLGVIDSLKERLANYSTIIIIANLAGKSGAALAPVISQAGKELGKNVLSFGIMPFKFEKDRIFFSGVSLKRLKTNSDCTIIVDNDALLESNPDLTPDSCNIITNAALLEVIYSLKSSSVPLDTNILSTSKDMSDVQTSLRDSIKMLYEDASPSNVKSSMLYVMGGNKVSVGILNSMVNTVSGIFNDDSTRVSLSVVAAENSRVILLTSIEGETRFDRYDPLGIIPNQNILDWDDPDCSIKLDLELNQIE
ncbi:MAG TPA: cell division protein FtsZ [Nitrosopumilaceae archaeon]|nr:cell division protein FtsZ [Nitrosopumilaceae archaeon]HXV39149.1 cell division protein FtsZ [Nitrosopumilaceae archaeon]